jgi:RNA polymerase sigma factor (sigma-70 family)
VYGVCRRRLDNDHDAEDAFQATFLVLARRAGSVAKHDSVRSWLYGVARKVAARAATVRGRLPTTPLPTDVAAPERDAAWADVRPVLDEEVGRLPEKYRSPVLLCYFEGRTYEEAARELGWPLGTVSTRLTRARERLRTCLARRGLALSAAAVTALVSETATAAVTADRARSAAAAALNSGAVSAKTLALAQGVIHTMKATKLKLAVALLLATGVIAGGIGGVAHYLRADGPEAVARPETPDPPSGDKKKPAPEKVRGTTVDALRQKKAEAARKTYQMLWVQFEHGQDSLDRLFLWSRNWVDAQLATTSDRTERVAACQAYVDRTRKLAEINRERYKAARVDESVVHSSEYHLAEAEILLALVKEE